MNAATLPTTIVTRPEEHVQILKVTTCANVISCRGVFLAPMNNLARITTNAAMTHTMTAMKKIPNVSINKALTAANAMTITVSLMTMVELVLILTSVTMTSITVTPMLLVITQEVFSLVLATQVTAEMESHVPTSMNALLDLIAVTLTRSRVTRLVHMIVSARIDGNLTMMVMLIPSALMSTNVMPTQV